MPVDEVPVVLHGKYDLRGAYSVVRGTPYGANATAVEYSRERHAPEGVLNCLVLVYCPSSSKQVDT